MSNPPKNAPAAGKRQNIAQKIDEATGALAGHVNAKFSQAKTETENRLQQFKAEVVAAVAAAVKKPDTLTDRFLAWVMAKPASWLIWPILALTHCIAASVWRALAD